MSVRMMALVWDSPLPRDQKFLMLCYADHADHYGESIYPSKTTVERMTGYSRRSVQTITAELVVAGLLIERGLSHLDTMSYAMDVERLEGLRGAQILRGAQKTAQGGRKKQHEGGANSAPKPPVKPSGDPPRVAEGDLFEGQPAPEHPEIPPAMRTPELLAAWGEWKRHRKEKRQTLTPTTMKKQVGQLAGWIAQGGEALALAALEHSTTAGYSGLFLPKGTPVVTKRRGPITQDNALRMPKKPA